MKLSRPEKFAYGVGDFGINLVFATTSSFLTMFYTDVAMIGAAAAGSILLVARVVDAIWDLFLGAMVDRTQTKWGQCRPYLLWASPVLALLLVLTFTNIDASTGVKVAYAMGSYTLLMCVFSLVGIPYSALPALMTDDPRQRTELAAWRMFLGMMGSATVGMVVFGSVEILGGGNAGAGYQRTTMVMAVVMVALIWFCFAQVKERVPPIAQPMDIQRDLRALLAGRAWIVLAAMGVTGSISLGLITGISPYFVKYAFADTSIMGPATFVMGLGLLSGVVASVWLTARFCKRKIMMCAWAFGACTGSVLYFVPLSNLWLFGSIAFLGQIAGGIAAPIAWSMLADTADEAELRTGRRMVGLSACSLTFAGKLGFALGGALLGFALAAYGYQPNVAQTPETIDGLKKIACFGPALANVISVVLLQAYPLGQLKLDEIRVGLQRARALA